MLHKYPFAFVYIIMLFSISLIKTDFYTHIANFRMAVSLLIDLIEGSNFWENAYPHN